MATIYHRSCPTMHFIGISLALGLVTVSTVCGLSPTVQLDNATFTGFNSGQVSKFLGIPFAQPPCVFSRRLSNWPRITPVFQDGWSPVPLAPSYQTVYSKWWKGCNIIWTLLPSAADQTWFPTRRRHRELHQEFDFQRRPSSKWGLSDRQCGYTCQCHQGFQSTCCSSTLTKVAHVSQSVVLIDSIKWIFGGAFELGGTSTWVGPDVLQAWFIHIKYAVMMAVLLSRRLSIWMSRLSMWAWITGV